MHSRNRKKRCKQRAEYLQKREDILSQENKAKARERYMADPEKKKASVRDTYKADPEKKKASVRDTYKADPEKKKASVRDTYNANAVSKRAAKRQRYQEGVEENRAAKRQRYQEGVEENRAAKRQRYPCHIPVMHTLTHFLYACIPYYQMYSKASQFTCTCKGQCLYKRYLCMHLCLYIIVY